MRAVRNSDNTSTVIHDRASMAADVASRVPPAGIVQTRAIAFRSRVALCPKARIDATAFASRIRQPVCPGQRDRQQETRYGAHKPSGLFALSRLTNVRHRPTGAFHPRLTLRELCKQEQR